MSIIPNHRAARNHRRALTVALVASTVATGAFYLASLLGAFAFGGAR
jgi:hypothetical protein